LTGTANDASDGYVHVTGLTLATSATVGSASGDITLVNQGNFWYGLSTVALTAKGLYVSVFATSDSDSSDFIRYD